MLKVQPASLVLGFLLLFAEPHHQLLAQYADCPTGEAALVPNDPAYADAVELIQRLENHGFNVLCMFPTPLGGMFRVEEGDTDRSTITGEVNFRTNHGDIEVFFVPKYHTFAEFKITERRRTGQYVYTFGGTPRVREGFKIESTGREYFLRHHNALLLVDNDKLRVRLEGALETPRTP